jgi:3-keto-L-gulonate-6-phosphate decarboxylase
MFALEETEIAKAVKRARELHPTVRVIRFGQYLVSGSHGKRYTVRCYRDQRGHKIIDCDCRTQDGVACKHGMAAVPLHIWMAESKHESRYQ